MPFMRAGFNFRNKSTNVFGWTRPANGRRFALAELIRFASGDLAWIDAAAKPRFLAWGDQVVIGSRPEFDLPMEWQHGLPMSVIPSPERRPRPVKLRLSYPVSANRYWRTFAYIERGTHKARAVTAPSDEAKAFKEECGWLAKAAGVRVPFTGLIELHIRLIPENRVCMDLDNSLKVAIDALKGIVYEDDSQIYRIVAERGDADPTGKRLEVEVRPYLMPMALEAAA
jgi:crossover junction endodeoxyribonuclease RusA